MSQPKKSEISERVILYRKRAGMTQQELADSLGISNDYVSLIETQKKSPGASLWKLFTTLEADQKRKIDEFSDSVDADRLMEGPLKKSPPAPVPTPTDCVRYLEQYLKRCGDDLGKIAWVYHELRNHFPVNFDLEKTAREHVEGAETEFDEQRGRGARGRNARKSRQDQDTSQAPSVPPGHVPPDPKKPHS
jgi:transcriptional regulator with XRE-family HTH domain